MALAIPDLPDFAGLDAKVLVVQLECPVDTVAEALRRAKQAGLTTVMNTAPARTLPDHMLELTDILVANEVEMALLAGVPVSTVEEAGGAARVLRHKGASNIVVTLGKRGAICLTAEGEWHRVEASGVETVDTTGAGDTFVGYLASTLAVGRPLLEALRRATRAAGVSVTREGATSSIPYADEIG